MAEILKIDKKICKRVDKFQIFSFFKMFFDFYRFLKF